MSKCSNCQANIGIYNHFNGNKICDNCLGEFFTCPDCGMIYDRNDYENADQGNGFCIKCAPNH